MYKYVTLFLLNFIEGSIVTFGAGLGARVSSLNYLIAIIVLITADIMSDIVYYFVGRCGLGIFPSKFTRFVGATPKRLRTIEHYYANHGKVTLFFAKMSDVFAMPAIIVAGAIRMNISLYISISTVTSIVKALLLFSAGYLLSASIGRHGAVLIEHIVSAVFMLLFIILVAWYFYAKIKQNKS